MIENLLSRSRVTEVSTVATQTSRAFGESEIADPTLSTSFTSLSQANLELSKAINRLKAESVLEEKDEARDYIVRSLYYLVTGYSYHPSVEIKEAAKRVMKIFENFGLNITTESYATESSLIHSMLLEFQKPEYEGAITLLSGCADLLEMLADTQSDFEQAQIAYETEKTNEGITGNASVLKVSVVDILNKKIIPYLGAMENINPGMYALFAGTFARIIAENNEQVRRRQQKPEPVPEQPA